MAGTEKGGQRHGRETGVYTVREKQVRWSQQTSRESEKGRDRQVQKKAGRQVDEDWYTETAR